MIDPLELHALADGELSADEAADLRRRIDASASAQAELRAILALKRAVREKVAVVECRGEWRVCLARLDEMDKTRRVERFVGRYAWGICGVLFVTILAGGLTSRTESTNSVNTADLARIVPSLARRQAPPAEEAARERWLDGLMGQARRSADPNRMEIRGYADGQLDGRPVTCFSLHDSGGDLALLVMPGVLDVQGTERLRLDQSFRLGHLQGFNCVAWTDGRYTLAVVGDRSYEDLTTAAGLLSGRLR